MRVLVRRPHAYTFLGEYLAPADSQMTGAVDGVTLEDGTRLPIPGVYVLDSSGDPLGRVSLLAEDAAEQLRDLLGGAPEEQDR